MKIRNGGGLRPHPNPSPKGEGLWFVEFAFLSLSFRRGSRRVRSQADAASDEVQTLQPAQPRIPLVLPEPSMLLGRERHLRQIFRELVAELHRRIEPQRRAAGGIERAV